MQSDSIPGSGIEQVIVRCGKGEEIPLSNQRDINNLVDRLCYVNYRQWNLEDAIRSPDITAQQCLEMVRAIHSSNAERTKLIELIDRYFVEEDSKKPKLAGESLNDSKITYHETLGQLIDSLIILYIRKYKINALHQSRKPNGDDAAWMKEAISAIQQQILLCEQSFKLLHFLLRTNQATLPPYTKYKLYKYSR